MLAFSVGSSDACGVSRTMGIWADEESMFAFVASDAHAEAMNRTAELSFTGKTTHWEATADELMELDWDVARERLLTTEPFDHYYE
jgi:hypothetical protein